MSERCGECCPGRPCWGNWDVVCSKTGGARRPDPESDEWRALGSWLVAGGVRVDVSEAGAGSLVIRWQEPGFFSQVRLPMELLGELVGRAGYRLSKAEGGR